MLAKTRRHDVMFGNMQSNSLLKCLWYQTFHIVLRWLGILCNVWIGTWKFLKKLYAQSMPILAWTYSGKNTKILTKNKALIFVSYTLQDVIAISVLHHGLIYFLRTKSESQPQSMEKTDSRKAAYASICLLFSCKIFKSETQYYSLVKKTSYIWMWGGIEIPKSAK